MRRTCRAPRAGRRPDDHLVTPAHDVGGVRLQQQTRRQQRDLGGAGRLFSSSHSSHRLLCMSASPPDSTKRCTCRFLNDWTCGRRSSRGQLPLVRIRLPDVAHHAAAVAATVRHQHQDGQAVQSMRRSALPAAVPFRRGPLCHTRLSRHERKLRRLAMAAQARQPGSHVHSTPWKGCNEFPAYAKRSTKVGQSLPGHELLGVERVRAEAVGFTEPRVALVDHAAPVLGAAVHGRIDDRQQPSGRRTRSPSRSETA